MNAAGRARRNATRSEKRNAAVRRRREKATAPERARVAAESRRHTRRIWLGGIGIFVALGLIGLGVFLLWPEDSPDLSLHGRKLASKAPEQTFREPPASYRVLYTADLGTGELFDQELLVRSPFDSSYRVGQAGSLDAPIFVVVRTATGLYDTSKGSTEITRATPALSDYAYRLDAVSADLLANGFFERRERRELNGEACTAYRTGASIDGGGMQKPTADAYTDWCVADDGLLLQEVRVVSGKLQLRSTATSVERDKALTDTDFPVPTDAATLDSGGVKVTEVSTSSAPVSPYWRPATVPSGWTLASRSRVDVTKKDPDTEGPAVTKTSWVDVYRRGNAFVTVRQGGLGEEPFVVDTTAAIDATAGPLGAAKLALGASGPTLVVADKDSRFVQLAGTVDVATLQSFAASLTLG